MSTAQPQVIFALCLQQIWNEQTSKLNGALTTPIKARKTFTKQPWMCELQLPDKLNKCVNFNLVNTFYTAASFPAMVQTLLMAVKLLPQ